jgi:hypothetical protein
LWAHAQWNFWTVIADEVDRLPRTLFVRSMIIGTVLGGITSALQVVQAKIGRLREEEMRRAKAAEKEEAVLGRPTPEPEEAESLSERGKKWWSVLSSWFPGLGG